MSARRLVAVMACRADSTRLYAKPLQNLVLGTSVLDQKLDTLAALPQVVADSVLAIADGIDNLAYVEYAKARGASYIFGSKPDILSRLVNGGLYAGATDVMRLTSENPFIWWEKLEEAWSIHQHEANDLTVTDGCPLGSYFEIIRMDALLEAQQNAVDYQREACTQYFRDNLDRFTVQVLTPPDSLARLDVRLTIDQPEDLVVCRRIYEHLQSKAPLIPLQDIIDYWDSQPLFRQLLGHLISGKGIWINNHGCAWAPSTG